MLGVCRDGQDGVDSFVRAHSDNSEQFTVCWHSTWRHREQRRDARRHLAEEHHVAT